MAESYFSGEKEIITRSYFHAVQQISFVMETVNRSFSADTVDRSFSKELITRSFTEDEVE